MPTRTINMEVEKQEGPRCTAYSTANLIQYLYRQKYGISIKLDPMEFYERTKFSDKSPRLDRVCAELEKKGIKTLDGKYIKIKSFIHVLRGNIWQTVKSGGPMLIVIDTEKGEPIHKRLNKDLILRARTKGSHAIVAIEVDGAYMCIADSNKTTPDFWFLPMTMQKIITDAYYITL